ncbi:helix-turn-helix domain-containing protein [Metabacillus halosaccharovorans]|uniref:Helix-turn-helix domain-containing protein n=1 Tax=Metabacillus halosaccharovorans TaxID=930124 RepID=A0ABT3DNN8_9BACI|nr:helix-turn-helix domain-containing protein [Metabacillus halosaccharovorans]MCV9888678.1 helix-turn-helix domain-containing protein [Metabacillus halosaccharovorans]
MKTKMPKIFRRFLLSYVIILLFPLITGFISYQVSIDVAKTSSIDTSKLILNKSKDILESRIMEIERFTRQIALEDFNQHLTARTEPNAIDIYSLRETSRFVSKYTHSNDFLEDFYIYLKNYDAVLKEGAVFFRVDHFYETYHYNDLSFDQWKKTILHGNYQGEILPLRSYTSNNKELSVITYLQSLPFNSLNQPLGTAVLTIDQRKINILLEGISKQYGGWAFITDKEGNPITIMGIKEKQAKEIVKKYTKGTDSINKVIENETMLLSIQSDLNGWNYVAGIPKEGLMEKAEAIKHITMVVTVSTLIIGMLLCLFLAYRDSSPIHNLIDVVREQIGPDATKHNNEFDFLHGNISNLISNNKLLKREITNHKDILKDSFIKSLLSGEFYDQEGMIERAEQLNVLFRGEYGYVCILRINGYGDMENKEIHNELSASRFLIKRTIKELEPSIVMTDLNIDKIVIIITCNSANKVNVSDELLNLLNELSSSVANSYRISISAYVGKSFQNFKEINRSYYEAKQALDSTFSEISKSEILRYQDIARETSMYYYPMDLELRLINAMKTGEAYDIKQIMAQIFQENFSNRELSPKIVEQLLEEIKSTLIKGCYSATSQGSGDSIKLVNRVLQVHLNLGLNHVWNEFELIADEYCSLVNKRKNESNDQAIKLIIEFLEDHYHDPDLSLYRISEKVGFPEKFVSQLFKEKLGEYVSDYIEKIRINKASELLLGTDMTIEEISSEVGYNSAHSFRRAFKRVLHVTPKAYRQAALGAQ